LVELELEQEQELVIELVQVMQLLEYSTEFDSKASPVVLG
jgi:hypothetical protein